MKPSAAACILSGASGVLGVVVLVLSFVINKGPEPGVTGSALAHFAQQYYAATLRGAWMQTVGAALIMTFALSLVYFSNAMHRLAGWLTLFGSSILMTVTLIEVTFYISALHDSPSTMPAISLDVISAVQHLYFIVAAPAVFLPLSAVLLESRVLPRVFAFSALALGIGFAVLGLVFLFELRLPDFVTNCASVQALWWFAAAVTVSMRSKVLASEPAGGGVIAK